MGVKCVYIYAFKSIRTLTILIIELHWSVNLPENIQSLVSDQWSYQQFYNNFLSCFSWWCRAWSPTPSPARRCNTDSCWKRKYLNILRQAHCRVLVLIFICWLLYVLVISVFFRAVTQIDQFVNGYFSGFLYLLIVIVVRVHLHDSVDTLNVTTRKSRNISKTNRISLHIQWSILSGLNLPQLCMIAKPKK